MVKSQTGGRRLFLLFGVMIALFIVVGVALSVMALLKQKQHLPNGYKLIEEGSVHSIVGAIHDSHAHGGYDVSGQITKAAVHDEYVIAYVSDVSDNTHDWRTRPGWVFLNTWTDYSEYGLSDPEYAKRLEDLGIEESDLLFESP